LGILLVLVLLLLLSGIVWCGAAPIQPAPFLSSHSCSAVGGGLQKLAIPVWTRPTGALVGSFPLMTRQKLKSNYLNSIRTNPHPLNYLYISGGVSSPHPPKTIFLRRDILFVRYTTYLHSFPGITASSSWLRNKKQVITDCNS